ncbi:50S ribosomal protein L5 [Candidatus Methylacidithermus pantelleriae]|uniref:Large ribosomal subunit protein uL5 n=1 Tax=Candidatus Methylacidithermus pantelleriae TaxID=2744239 RepID=A0A8J2FWF2_9BACT|nr:50S ribosomal protein L5 [Candidatus Methylacidithermus pantelleriae]CAF0698871.1 50S ribosomal subunit protein L5 [Candidatus Methylacidithermus pantelleriae]
MGEKSVLQEKWIQEVRPGLLATGKYCNLHEVPKLEKIVINCCVGSAADPKVAVEEAIRQLSLITGQRPIRTVARKSISNFKLRKGQPIGCKVTLRGRRMFEFLERLLWAALPRVRDFRGLSPRSFDGRGNYTFGIEDPTVFPEVELEETKRSLGFDITIVTTARTDAEAKELLARLGIPFADMKKPEVVAA